MKKMIYTKSEKAAAAAAKSRKRQKKRASERLVFILEHRRYRDDNFSAKK